MEARIRTALIWQQVRSQFGRGHVNPRNNLAHCFGCCKNLNNIDLLLTLGYDFKTAVSILTRMYEQHRLRLPCAETPVASN